MKRVLFAVLCLFIWAHVPWKLLVLATEVCFVSPGWTRVESGHDQYWEALDLENRLETMGWNVQYAPMKGLYGLTNPGEHTITIDETLGWNARFAILAHEGAHTLQPAWVDREEAEVFAEDVAMLVVRNGVREHARYLSSHKAAMFATLVEWRAIYHAAAVLEDR